MATHRVRIESKDAGIPEVYDAHVDLTRNQVVALKNFINRIADGSLPENESELIEKASLRCAQGRVSDARAADLIDTLDATPTPTPSPSPTPTPSPSPS